MQTDPREEPDISRRAEDGSGPVPDADGVTEKVLQGEHLALYQRFVERLTREWPGFLARRSERLAPHPIIGEAAEKVTESILEDLFTQVLDWPLSCFNPQIQRADIVLSELGFKRLIIEAKRPASLAWHRSAVDRAMEQVLGYASAQKVQCVAVSDGHMLFAADLIEDGRRDRIFVSLGNSAPPAELWWLSRGAIYRPRDIPSGTLLRLLPERPVIDVATDPEGESGAFVHPKYKLPACCFAYVGDHSKTATWKLPYLLADGTVDAKRLPKAIQSILTNYRGVKVSKIPEGAIPSVLDRLARAAAQAGHMPPEAPNPAPVYRQLALALEQLKARIKGQTDGDGE